MSSTSPHRWQSWRGMGSVHRLCVLTRQNATKHRLSQSPIASLLAISPQASPFGVAAFHCGCWAASLASRTRFPSFDQGNLAARNVSVSFFTSTRRKSRAECCPLLRPVWRCPDGGRIECGLTPMATIASGAAGTKLSIERGRLIDRKNRHYLQRLRIDDHQLVPDDNVLEAAILGRMSTIVAGTS
jgi:hypothetical protein